MSPTPSLLPMLTHPSCTVNGGTVKERIESTSRSSGTWWGWHRSLRYRGDSAQRLQHVPPLKLFFICFCLSLSQEAGASNQSWRRTGWSESSCYIRWVLRPHPSSTHWWRLQPFIWRLLRWRGAGRWWRGRQWRLLLRRRWLWHWRLLTSHPCDVDPRLHTTDPVPNPSLMMDRTFKSAPDSPLSPVILI